MARQTCRDDIPVLACDNNSCVRLCTTRHGLSAVGKCNTFFECYCYYDCKVKKMDGRKYGVAPLPSRPNPPTSLPQ